MSHLFTVRDGRVVQGGKTILSNLSFDLPADGITVILGPGGAGKSVLVRSLSGPLVEGSELRREGSWTHRGATGPELGERPVHHLAQTPRHRDSGTYVADLESAVREAMEGGADLLVDEAVDRLPEEAREDAARLLEQTRGHMGTVVVTHDVGFARRIADHVLLVTGGTVVVSCDGATFFTNPPSELARRFVAQGNAWPDAAPPALPSHFRFIVPGLLAGMGRPGLLGDVEADLEAIAHAGISTLVSLTEDAFPTAMLRPYGIHGRHVPIEDMGVPAVRTAYRLAADISRSMDQGEAVALHCHAGLGRTGTMLAAVLILRGDSAADAVMRLRATGRGYVQSRSQETFLRMFESECR